ncbi:site-specific integrase [Sphingobium fuliginis]|uniref:Site-specific integrase n=1 Tax=Sphingobium fuliginis (strain ATCC 27551) TaxID=336203 RepID=A0A7M2GGM8_SPHSA|nr:site-specific integrase [Sphingobium fuliginis]QOT71876.1 site-specific integrase [Sphingobium fuliginis]
MTVKISLSRKSIRALRKGERITEKGITAEKLTDGVEGEVRYSINIMVDGERHHRIIGKASEGVTLTQAQEAIELLRTRAREERLDLPKGRKIAMSFKEAADGYIKRMEEGGGKNMKAKRQHLTMHLKPYFAQNRLDKLTTFDLSRYRAVRREAGASDATINREFATLSHLYRSAVSWKWISRDRLPEFKKEAEAVKPISVLSDADADALMKSALEDEDDRLWLFVAFGLGAAMRHREILRARYDQVDFDTRRIFIPQAKAGEREQPITPSLARAIKRQMEKEADSHGWIFPAVNVDDSKTGYRTNMGRQFARAVVRAKLDPSKVTPHTMRHTAITRLVKAGVDLPTIQRISAHKTLTMVLRYTHIHGQHVDRALDAMDRCLPRPISQELHRGSSQATDHAIA